MASANDNQIKPLTTAVENPTSDNISRSSCVAVSVTSATSPAELNISRLIDNVETAISSIHIGPHDGIVKIRKKPDDMLTIAGGFSCTGIAL